MKAFTLENIVQGNGVAISITGMAIVFSGLIIMSVFIYFLPRILEILDRTPEEDRAPEKTVEAPEAENEAVEALPEAALPDEDSDIASLIGLILHLENERLYQSDQQYITINRDPGQQGGWGRTGKLRKTPHRRSYAKV